MAIFSSLITSLLIGSSAIPSPRAGGNNVSILTNLRPPLAGGYYSPNRAPLQPSAFLKLPPGAVTPKGWLRHQLQLDAEGIPGRLDEISRFLDFKNCGWVDPTKSGWEELPYWLRGYGDLGYVLKDERIIATTKRWIEAMMATAQPDGYFGPLEQKPTGSGDQYDAKDPWAHMLAISCLRSYYDYTHDARALTVISNFLNWMNRQPARYFGSGWGALRWADQMANIYWLYNINGDKSLLKMTELIYQRSLNYETNLTNGHNVNWAQGFRQPAEFWQQTRDPKHLKATYENYRQVMATFGQFPGGGVDGDEIWRTGYTDPRNGFETCGYVEYMLSFEMLQRITGDTVWADRCEDIAFNSLTAALTPDHRGIHYITPANVISLTQAKQHTSQFCNDFPMLGYEPSPHNYRCCPHNYGMGWPYFAETLWSATADKGISATMYSASSVTAKAGDGSNVTIEEETDYPFRDSIRFHVKAAGGNRFPLYLRVPGWCKNPSITVNGKALALKAARPGSTIRIERNWGTHDVVALQLPMQPTLRKWSGKTGAVSVDYGPLTFSLNLAEKWSGYDAEKFSQPNWGGQAVTTNSAWNYGLDLKGSHPEATWKISRKPGPLAANPFTKDGATLRVDVPARRIANWVADPDANVGPLQASPAYTQSRTETLSLIPMGAARLRITSFPVASSAPTANHWHPAPKALISVRASNVEFPYNTGALFNGVEPSSSHDTDVPRFSWFSHRGGSEWVQFRFKSPIEVSSLSAYWFADRDHPSYVPYPGMGQFDVPSEWRVEYLDGASWKAVGAKAVVSTRLDQYNEVKFPTVMTRALRIVAKMKPGTIGALSAVRIASPTEQLVPTQTASAEAILSRVVAEPIDRNVVPASETVPSASTCFAGDTVLAMNEAEDPANSNDHSIRRQTWWDHRGGTEWAQYEFKSPRTVSSTRVYWFADGAGCALPESWNLEYRDGNEWKPVSASAPYGLEPDQYNQVEFKPVVTSALRVVVKLQDGKSAGILRWRVAVQK